MLTLPFMSGGNDWKTQCMYVVIKSTNMQTSSQIYNPTKFIGICFEENSFKNKKITQVLKDLVLSFDEESQFFLLNLARFPSGTSLIIWMLHKSIKAAKIGFVHLSLLFFQEK